jgi:hypothetical protein
MKFKEIITRLTGISCPVFGVSWNPPEADRRIAQRVISFLEDRRVLYVPSEIEIPEHCIESVIKIREMLTSELCKLDSGDELAQSIKAMRSACRKFLNKVQSEDESRIIRFGNHPGHYASWEFNQALGEMRGVIGVIIACMAAEYGLDVEDDLAKIIPETDKPG